MSFPNGVSAPVKVPKSSHDSPTSSIFTDSKLMDGVQYKLSNCHLYTVSKKMHQL